MEAPGPILSEQQQEHQKKQKVSGFLSLQPRTRTTGRGKTAIIDPDVILEQESFTRHGKELRPFNSLPLNETALNNFTSGQKKLLLFLGVGLVGALLADWHLTLVVLLGFFTLMYFIDVIFNLFLVYRSFSRQPEINISKEETNVVPGATWPTYTVFCPLYKEWEVVPQFAAAMSKLDYPKNKLQIILLLEEDDQKTIQSIQGMDLPAYFQTVIVPHSLPKTKPKAMNYGLRFAAGEYIVIYDAEDVPDPQQLKKAVLAFAKAPEGTVCVQAKLNFYNPKQNLLTKVFTAEYSLWFDLILPGLQSVDAPIPLGGTSNHFKTANLKKLKGWDAFNVTEDCDLGIRLSKAGFKTAIFNSTTWEEANSKLKNWYSQRSRWIKGYMQTYFVHMRQWKMFWQQGRMRDLGIFQLTVGGKVISIFVNPAMWALTFAYFAFRPTLGHLIESFFPWPILYMGVFAFVFGNFFYLYHYMIGCAKRGFDGLIKYSFLVPFYWLGMSLAAWKALSEVIFKPHYWAKTKHGLHLQPNTEQQPEPFAIQPGRLKRVWAYLRTQGMVSDSSILIAAGIASSFLNFLFNALLGRMLTLEDFSVLTLFNTMMVFFTIITSALTTTVNHRTAYVSAKSGIGSGISFRAAVRKKSFITASTFALVWLVIAPALMAFFKIPGLMLGFAFTPVLYFGLLIAVDRGFLQGTTHFAYVGLAMLTEAAVKLAAALALSALGLSSLVALSLPISLAVAFALTWYLAFRARAAARPLIAKTPPYAYRFPRRFFTAAILTGCSSVAFLSLDVVLAKHFLTPIEAGQYALLSLAGKAVFYLGSMLSVFIVTFTGRDEGAGKDPNPLFYRLLTWTTLLVGLAWAGLGLFGNFAVPFLFGSKAVSILPLLAPYVTAIALFTIGNAFVVYHLARKQMVFSIVALTMTALMGLGLWMNHSSLDSFVLVMLRSGAAYLAVMYSLHLLQRNGRFILRNLMDLVDAFFPLAPAKAVSGKRILIFNWRDTRHVYAGGAEVYVHELAKRWVAAGHHVTLFCGNDGKSLRLEMVDGVRVIRRGGFYFVYLWAFVYYLLQFRGRFDLVIDCQNGIPFFTPLYVKERVVCLLHHVHQEVFRKYLSAPLALLASVLENRVMPWAYRHAKFLTISDSSKRNMRDLDLGLEGVNILHPGVDLSFLHPGQKDPEPLVLYLGRLKAYKSVDVLIRAFKNITAKIPQARLIIAGSGEEEKNLKGLACGLQLEDQVEFLGKVTEQEKLSLLQRAWVLANPSMVEGWGITTIEANACGAPVVAADVPGLRDSVKNPHTGYLVPHGDVNGFSEKIIVLLENEELRAKMGAEALRWAQNFDWQRLAQQGMKLLND